MSTLQGRAGLALLALIAAGALAGCAKSSDTSSPGAIKIAAANGKIALAHVPSRIVSLSPSATEDLYAVGAGRQVVAVDSYSSYPPRAPRTNLSEQTPNVEALANYRPDLVVTSADSSHLTQQLAKLGVAVLVEPPAANLSDLYGQLSQLAEATGHRAAAAPVIAGIRKQVSAIIRSVPRPARPLAVYHELDQTFFSATSQTFIGQIYTLLGLRNIADKARAASSYPKLSAEYIVRANPDLIVLADTVCCGQTPATVSARPGWQSIKAVKNQQLLAVNDSLASEWGPRIVLFLQSVAKQLRTVQGRGR